MVASSAASIRSVRRKPYALYSLSGGMLSYFPRVGPRPESSGSFSSIAGFEKELPRTPVKDVLSSEEDEEKKEVASPTQLRLEDLGTYPPEIPSLEPVFVLFRVLSISPFESFAASSFHLSTPLFQVLISRTKTSSSNKSTRQPFPRRLQSREPPSPQPSNKRPCRPNGTGKETRGSKARKNGSREGENGSGYFDYAVKEEIGRC